MEIDSSRWSGDGSFTQVLIDALQGTPGVRALRVEDAPSSRADTGYNFIANEIFVLFEPREALRRIRLLGVLPMTRRSLVPALTLGDLEQMLTSNRLVGAPDYSDGGMIQYLRTERIVPPYQTRGTKIVEMVRIYEAATAPTR